MNAIDRFQCFLRRKKMFLTGERKKIAEAVERMEAYF